jgi:hypothetical protein
MEAIVKSINILLLLPSMILASGGPSGAGGTTAQNAAEVRTLSERVPAGGTVQVKYLLTQPRPISSAGSRSAAYGFSVDGVSITSPLGDAAGAAVMKDGYLYISVVSPNSDWGMNLDYPFLTVTMDIPASTPAGSVFPLTLSDSTAQSLNGPLTFADSKPGTLTIGGSVSINGVFPGGGTQPGGTVIKVRGTGFQPGSKISAKMKIANPVYISPTEMQFTLQETTTMDTQPIQVNNPDGSQVVFYSYLRGSLVAVPSRALLQHTEPVFQSQTHALATLTVAGNNFTALAVQNPTQGPVAVTIVDQTTNATGTIVLQPGQRAMDEIAALLGGTAVLPGDTITVMSTSAIQILGLLCDDNAGTVTPFLPAF